MIEGLKRQWDMGSAQNLTDFEKKIRFDLPEDYRIFIISQNGGSFDTARLFPTRVGTEIIEEGIETFYGLNTPVGMSLTARFDAYHVKVRRMPDYMIAIGRDQGGNQICMLLNNRMFGWVVLWDHENEVDFDDPDQAANPIRNCRLIAKSFSDFAALIRQL